MVGIRGHNIGTYIEALITSAAKGHPHLPGRKQHLGIRWAWEIQGSSRGTVSKVIFVGQNGCFSKSGGSFQGVWG